VLLEYPESRLSASEEVVHNVEVFHACNPCDMISIPLLPARCFLIIRFEELHISYSSRTGHSP